MNRVLLGALILGVSIIGLSIGSTVPVVALRLYQAGAPNVQIGLMSALPAAGMMMSAFIVGWLCKRLSRRHIYLCCFSLSALSIAVLEVIPSTLAILAVARLAMGLAAGTIIILGESWVNEIAMDSYRGRIVAIYTTCFTVFQLLGPAMVSVFGTVSAQVNSVVVAGHILALAVIWFILPRHLTGPSDTEHKTFSILGFVQVAPALCMGIIFFSFFDSVILSMFPVYAADHGYPLKLAALMVTVILLGDAMFQFPLGWLSDNLSRPAVYLGCGVLSLGIGMSMPFLMNHPLFIWPCLVLLGAVAGGVYTLAIILIGEKFTGQDLITANACAGLLWGVGSLLGPLISGVAMTGNANGLPLTLSAAALLFVLFALQLLRKTCGVKALE
ncbi:MFS transporter [Pseudomonas syringae pv. philadelphi]|uniref:MFS transporter n=1 Tax=Pseudomonas syringae pv. philadelphi TaxID=251706 RepID=A0A3M3YXX7_9PSED|nr:MFS transporter [Pseudomonas syringae group genomosp. 3]RMO87136.1 MFS transporter [Pseudomonas syringae pv. philadelphi]